MEVQICDIRVMDRIRKDNGDLQELAASIEQLGLIHPITLMECETGYVLLAGFRRFSAMQLLKRDRIDAKVVSPLDAEEQLRIEIEENEVRKEFTPSEKVVYASKLKIIEAEKARKRMNWRANQPPTEQSKEVKDEAHGRDDCPTHKGRTRDEVAKKVGFSSGKILERATYVAEHRPDLMEQVDAGQKSISTAYEEAKGRSKRKKQNVQIEVTPAHESMGMVNGKYGHIAIGFNRQDGIDFILYELNTAATMYLNNIRATSNRYTDSVVHNPANTEKIKQIIQTTFDTAFALFTPENEEE